jgi:uncharacterized membrane protein
MDDNGSIMHGASPFRAVLHPHRSLDPRGFLILMLALGAVIAVIAASIVLK